MLQYLTGLTYTTVDFFFFRTNGVDPNGVIREEPWDPTDAMFLPHGPAPNVP